MAAFTESVVEEAALGWLGELDYSVLHGPDIAAGGPAAERGDVRGRSDGCIAEAPVAAYGFDRLWTRHRSGVAILPRGEPVRYTRDSV